MIPGDEATPGHAATAGILRCPHCHAALQRQMRVYRCANGHSFDIARQGYVNLLAPSRRHSRDPGDNREMILARRRFLESGRYHPIAEQINQTVLAALPARPAPQPATILDAGAGEGYYLAHLVDALAVLPPAARPQCYGVDVSRHGMQYATHRTKAVIWLVASIVDLPVMSASVDVVLSVFAPLAPAEFQRVLRAGGTLIVVAPGPGHLQALRELVYTDVRAHQRDQSLGALSPYFTLCAETNVCYDIDLPTPAAIADLLTMTPFGWNIGQERWAQAERSAPLRTGVEVLIRRFRC